MQWIAWPWVTMHLQSVPWGENSIRPVASGNAKHSLCFSCFIPSLRPPHQHQLWHHSTLFHNGGSAAIPATSATATATDPKGPAGGPWTHQALEISAAGVPSQHPDCRGAHPAVRHKPVTQLPWGPLHSKEETWGPGSDPGKGAGTLGIEGRVCTGDPHRLSV